MKRSSMWLKDWRRKMFHNWLVIVFTNKFMSREFHFMLEELTFWEMKKHSRKTKKVTLMRFWYKIEWLMFLMKLFKKKKNLIYRQLKKAKEIGHLKNFKNNIYLISKGKLMHQQERPTDLKLFHGMMDIKAGLDKEQVWAESAIEIMLVQQKHQSLMLKLPASLQWENH